MLLRGAQREDEHRPGLRIEVRPGAGRRGSPERAAAQHLVRHAETALEPVRHEDVRRGGVGFPGRGPARGHRDALNLDRRWIGTDLRSALEKALRKPVRSANDADVQGLGVIRGRGVELVITLGTGFGSALFVDGHLVPNVQLAHHSAWGEKTYEEELGAKALDKAGRKKWNRRLGKAIASLDALFNYDRLYIGGGNARKVERDLPPNVRLVSNLAGLTGGIALWRSQS